MATTGIYKITDRQNNKIYIGQSVNIEKRWASHKNILQKHTKIDLAIAKKGANNFVFEVVEECSREKLNEREVFWIDYYDSFHKGYNQTTGGDSPYWAPVKLSVEQANKIKYLLKNTGESQINIAHRFRVSQPTIAMINTGETWKDNLEDYPLRKTKKELFMSNPIVDTKPSKQKLLKIIKKHKGNFTQVAKEFQVSPATIRRWCAYHQMSTSSFDYRPKKTKNTDNQPVSVNMLDYDTKKIIKTFNSFLEAERFLNKKGGARHIKEVCCGKRQMAYGYRWSYKENT